MNDVMKLDPIPFQIDLTSLIKKLRIKEGSRYIDDLKSLVDDAQSIGKPKGLYKVAFIESKDDDHVVVNSIRLTSRVLRVNLEQAYRVFPYVATCGMELEEWARGFDDMLKRYWADAINEMVLQIALGDLENHLMEHYGPGPLSKMNPGSLIDWPIEEQGPLFQILGNPKDSIGVQLTESFMMIPIKSVSGIRFPTEESFESCQLCPREVCPGRRAPYEKDLYDRKYCRRSS
jgi:hypothetical protein